MNELLRRVGLYQQIYEFIVLFFLSYGVPMPSVANTMIRTDDEVVDVFRDTHWGDLVTVIVMMMMMMMMMTTTKKMMNHDDVI